MTVFWVVEPAVWFKFTDVLKMLVATSTGAIALMTARNNNPGDSHLHTRRPEYLRTQSESKSLF
jgi:hypothetical protein